MIVLTILILLSQLGVSPVGGLKPFQEILVFVLQDICTVVPHWIRYKELIGILEASLQDIVDRWADGKVRLIQLFFPTACS